MSTSNEAITLVSSSPDNLASLDELIGKLQKHDIPGDTSVVEVAAADLKPKPKSAPRKPRAKKTTIDGNAPEPKQKAARKPRVSKKASAETVASGGSTKSETKPKRKASVEKAKTNIETTSNYFAISQTKPSAPAKAAPCDLPLNIEAALPRRSSWTPPPPDTVLADPSSHNGEATPSFTAQKNSEHVFRSLNTMFTCKAVPEASRAQPDVGGQVLKKRKLVEMVSLVETTAASARFQQEAIKAPRKKVSTLTELAVAQYDDSHVLDLSFMANYKDPALLEAESAKNAVNPSKPKRKKKQVAPDPSRILLSPGTALKQADSQDFVFGTSSQLVREESPSVIREIQMAIEMSKHSEEESPCAWQGDNIEAYFQEQSMKLWNAACRDEDGSIIDLSGPNPASCIDGDVFFGANDTPTQDLETNAELLDMPADDSEFPDVNVLLARSPSIPRPESPLRFGAANTLSLLTSSPALPIRSSPVKQPSSPVLPLEDLSKPSELQPSPRLVENPISSHKKPLSLFPSPPSLNTLSYSQPSSRVAEFEATSVRNRSGMTGVSERYYTATQSGTLGSVSGSTILKSPFSTSASALSRKRGPQDPPSNKRTRSRRGSATLFDSSPPPSAQPPPPEIPCSPVEPKRKRGRPRKDSTAVSVPNKAGTVAKGRPRKTSPAAKSPIRRASPKKASPRKTSLKKASPSRPTIIEIPDSEDDDDMCSPVRVLRESSPESVASDNGYLATALAGDDTHVGDLSLALDPDAEKQEMFAKIMAAVKTAPRTSDLANPSWHERMLLYDPISYEDLTVWLNSGELSRVGYDDEVSPNDVKAWCDSKGICCVQRETRKGKERKRL